MAVITWPDYRVASIRWNKAVQAVVFKSIFGSQSLAGAAPLVMASISGVSETRAQGRLIESLFDSLNGFSNQLALWNVELPVPAGTMRGVMTLRDPVAQGQTFIIPIASGQAGKTLKAGDLLGIGSGATQQVVRVAADAVADGTGAAYVTIQTPMRNAFAAGAAVAWDRPKALFRLNSPFEGLIYGPEGAEPWSVELREDWRA